MLLFPFQIPNFLDMPLFQLQLVVIFFALCRQEFAKYTTYLMQYLTLISNQKCVLKAFWADCCEHKLKKQNIVIILIFSTAH